MITLSGFVPIVAKTSPLILVATMVAITQKSRVEDKSGVRPAYTLNFGLFLVWITKAPMGIG